MTASIPDIYSSIHMLLDNYVPPLTPRAEGNNNRYDMYYPHSVELFGKNYPELYFAGVAAYEKYVALYFFPIYSHPTEFTDIPDALKKMLKGKSCFHIKSGEDAVMKAIRLLLDSGFSFYQSKGLIKK